MSFLKYAVAVAAAAGIASASSSCTVSATTTITAATDATAVAACSTFSGSIAVATGVTDTLTFDGLEKLDGDLVVNNATQLTTISASTLQTITGKFSLTSLTRLTTLTFPELTAVDSIVWNALPNLESLDFTANVQTATTVNIQNTGLQSLDGISLLEVDTFYLANNRYIDTLDLALSSIGSSLIIEANKDTLSATFNNLSWANNMTFTNVTTITVPLLQSVNGSLGFYGDLFETFSAPNLTTVGKSTGGSLTFQDCQDVTNISLPVLTTVGGGFEIGNNPELHNLSLPKLETIGGALDFHGNLTSVSLPNLQDVKGAFNIQSTGDLTDDCKTFKELKSNGNIQGKFTCVGEQEKPGGTGTTPTATSSGSSSTSSSTSGAAAGLEIPALMGFAGAAAAAFGLL